MQTTSSNLFRSSKILTFLFRRKLWILIILFSLLIFLSVPFLFLLIGASLVSMLGGAQQEMQMQQSFDDAEWVLTAEGKRVIPAKYLPIYQKYGKEYGVPWPILAAIHSVETSFGRNLRVSSAGAVGHTQFMPCAWIGWEHYASKCDKKGALLPGVKIDITDPKNIVGGQGLDANGDGKADPNDPEDAIAATARRLAMDKKKTGKDWFQKGGPVWKYNPSASYVQSVKRAAEAFAQPTYKVVASGKIKSLIDEALSLRGITQYVFGGNRFPEALDCSSFVQHLYRRHFGINLPRTTDQQVQVGTPVDRKDLKPGDLVFFQNTYRPGVSHVGIYMGNGTFVHNQNTEKDVQVSKLEGYWDDHYLTARRVVKMKKEG